MKHYIIIMLTAAAVVILSSCEKYSTAEWIENAVTDYDGNTYNAVKIGKQVWMAENLRTEHFADGREIPYSQNRSYTEPYRYRNDDYEPEYQHQMFLNYGYYYNGAAVLDTLCTADGETHVQGICPDGWHIPSVSDWNILFQYINSHPKILGDSSNLFCSLSRAKDNSSLFSATMAGCFNLTQWGCHIASYNTYRAYFWTASTFDSKQNGIVVLREDNNTVEIIPGDISNAYSVRCVKN